MTANTKSRLLCKVCTEIQHVLEINDAGILLSCGHTRQETLPLEPGHVSLENSWSKVGRDLFPALRDDFRPVWTEY